MTRRRVIIKKTSESNIPVLISTSYESDSSYVTLVFGDRCTGIFDPFEGAFLLKINSVPFQQSDRAKTVKVDNIYGEAQILYRDAATAVIISEVSTSCYLCHFDTNERKLYLVQ